MLSQPSPLSGLSLRVQLLFVLVAAVALSLGITMISALGIEWDLHKERVARSLDTTARSAAIAVSAAVAFDDGRAAAEALGILAPQEEITAAAVYARGGGRLAVYGDSSRLPTDAGRVRARADFSPLSASASVFMPIVLDGDLLGHVYLHADLGAYRGSYLRQALLAVVASVLGLTLAIWLGLRFIDRITRPVHGLAALAHQVRESEDFSLRAENPRGSGDSREISGLVASFNALLAEVEKRRRELEEYHRRLENMVEERTRQLESANAALQVEIRIREQSEALIRANEETLRAQKQTAEEANRAKSRFLAAASHDLRQPLHALGLLISALVECLGAVDGESADGGGLAETRRLAGLIDISVRNMGNLLNDLLDLSRLEAGVVVPQQECVRVEAVFAQLRNRFQPLAADKGLRLRFMPCRLAVETDPILLDRVLANLIANAIRYTEQGGIVVGVRRQAGNRLRLDVIDSGRGIPEAMFGRIFEEYFQLGNPERGRDKGQGLGLSIVRRLLALMGVDIAVSSRLERGTRFSLALHRCEAGEAGHGAVPGVQRVSLPGQGKLVVLVEDDDAILVAMDALFRQWGIDLVAAPGLEAAQHALSVGRRRPDLVLSDYRLPGDLDGIGVVASFRARYGEDLPAVLITGDTGEEAIQAITRSGLRVLHKPLQPAKLRALLMHLLR